MIAKIKDNFSWQIQEGSGKSMNFNQNLLQLKCQDQAREERIMKKV